MPTEDAVDLFKKRCMTANTLSKYWYSIPAHLTKSKFETFRLGGTGSTLRRERDYPTYSRSFSVTPLTGTQITGLLGFDIQKLLSRLIQHSLQPASFQSDFGQIPTLGLHVTGCCQTCSLLICTFLHVFHLPTYFHFLIWADGMENLFCGTPKYAF